MLPRKPIEESPGPGVYENVNLDQLRKKTLRNVVMHPIPEVPEAPPKSKVGPATYDNIPP